jgi:UDP-N-acetylglucosamine--N-acetylmuramyl-(pentapeptide) pyrophosphoryl-undecaprenol N-acetylglucosamine transferase
MRIIITGGHFSPAYAVIQKIEKDNNILVIGRKHAFEGDKNETYEYRLCIDKGIPFKDLNAGRLQRKFTRYTLFSAAKFPGGIVGALKILHAFKPDVVVTFGGYIGLAVALAASVLRIPVILHEQTLRAGLSSKIIGKFASAVLISFESSRKYFKNEKVILTGNPIREEFFKRTDIKDFKSSLPLIYVTGGSTGAHAINEVFFELIPQLVKEYTIVHQTGKNTQFEDSKKAYELKTELPRDVQKNYIPRPFFLPEEVSFLFQNAALVVSRSGINTVTELMALGTPGLLIPLPFGQLNEQKENAQLFEKTGGGKYLEQNEMTPERLLATLHAMINEGKGYKKNAGFVNEYIHIDAADKISKIIYRYGGGENHEEGSTQKEKTGVSF